jgi:hypothetical protein
MFRVVYVGKDVSDESFADNSVLIKAADIESCVYVLVCCFCLQ